MKREDYNFLSSLLFSAISEGEAEPKIALRFATALMRREGMAFMAHMEEFINRCVPPKRRPELGKINPGRFTPQEKKPAVQIEDNAALFTAILATEFPHLKDTVACALTMKQDARFTIGRVGGKVWIRFGGQALKDPVGAVKAAAHDAEAMARGGTSAKEIRG